MASLFNFEFYIKFVKKFLVLRQKRVVCTKHLYLNNYKDAQIFCLFEKKAKSSIFHCRKKVRILDYCRLLLFDRTKYVENKNESLPYSNLHCYPRPTCCKKRLDPWTNMWWWCDHSDSFCKLKWESSHERCVRKVNVLGKKINRKKNISASVKALIYMKRSRSACSNMHVFKRVRQLLVRLVSSYCAAILISFQIFIYLERENIIHKGFLNKDILP